MRGGDKKYVCEGGGRGVAIGDVLGDSVSHATVKNPHPQVLNVAINTIT